MSKIVRFLTTFLLNMFPQTPVEYQTEEKISFEKDGRMLRGIKGKKDQIAMIEGVHKRNAGN